MDRGGDDGNGQAPLKGFVLCCTSLTTDVRTTLADVATQMGAVHKLDLTADVTHLIVGSITTPKYQYVAKDRPDIKVVAPAWLDAVRNAWMEGGDVDVASLEERHRLPTFSGLQICVTGFDNMDERGYISKTVEEQGASYHGDLTKQVTHLIAFAPQGAKYVHAKQWGLKVVSMKWFEDSLARGMALDEGLYDPTLPSDEQGKGAFRIIPRSRTSLGKRARDSHVGSGAGEEPGKKKLRRTASTRLESQSQGMWSQFSQREGGQTTADVNQWQDGSASEVTSKLSTSERQSVNTNPVNKPPEAPDAPQGLFCGCLILILGFDDKRTQLLHRFLVPNGATILHSPDELADASLHPFFKDRYLIMPHADADHTQPDIPPGTKIVTEWWVERCIHSKRLLDPSVDVLSRSLSHIHVPGFADLTITTTGFEGVDLRQIAQAVKLLGATYQEGLDKSTSVIISRSGTIKKEKAFYAQKHHIPVVTADWLWASINSTSLTSFARFTVQQHGADPATFGDDTSGPSPASMDTSKRGSGSASNRTDDSLPKRLSTARKRQATPSLPLQASRTPAPTIARAPPIVHEDDDDDFGSVHTNVSHPPAIQPPPPRRPHALQEVSPNRSPRKSSQQSPDETIEISSNSLAKASSWTITSAKDAVKDARDADVGAVSADMPEDAGLARPREQLTADLAELLSRQTASRPGSASETVPSHKRKSRPLGRAPSGISNRSLSASAHSDTLPQNPDAAVDGFTAAVAEPAAPSTQLGYETADTEAHRLKMGKAFQEESGLKRIASVGTVKDGSFTSGPGLGTRVKGRQRARH